MTTPALFLVYIKFSKIRTATFFRNTRAASSQKLFIHRKKFPADTFHRVIKTCRLAASAPLTSAVFRNTTKRRVGHSGNRK